ncbi:hypothetical protein LJR290_003946 [Variovorax sp. LjRoot290]|uniref:hypothetical protein n=1 Tax=Variovorax sp. LjRoot290 TaxID=3342316 RepID=UPI003ECE36C7
MAYTYLFFQPTRLPLEPHELGEATVLPLNNGVAIRAALARAIHAIDWDSDHVGRTQIDGQWIELHVPAAKGTLSLRCSLRADHSAIVQRLCDRLGWLAFDERPMCYQPDRVPMPA